MQLRVMLACLLLALTGCTTAFHEGEPLSITQPSSQAIAAEQGATFSTVAQGLGPFTFQWFRNGSALSGANTGSLTLPSQPLSNNGSQFMVRVTDSTMHTIDSAPAMLTVTPLSPDLTFVNPPTLRQADAPFTVSVNSRSAGAVGYSVVSGPATVAGSLVSLNGAGTVLLAATQAASGDYAAATAQTSFAVTDIQVSPVSPVQQTIAPGQVAFHAAATGGVTNALAWSASGGTMAANLWSSPNQVGSYTITATSVEDPTRSASTTAVVSAPVIVTQPTGQTVCPGVVVPLRVTALYDRTYQWTRNGVPLSGATQPVYTISGANASLDGGSYQVSVSNPAGTVVSKPALLQVGTLLSTNPVDLTISDGQAASFSAVADGPGPLAYQWFVTPAGASSGSPVPGAIAASLVTGAETVDATGSQFYVQVTDACGTQVLSRAATLTVNGALAPPTILTQPVGPSVGVGGTPTISVVATGSPVLAYQWYSVPHGSVTGVPLADAVSASYTLPASATTIGDDQDAYYVTVTNTVGSAASIRAVLTVGAGIEILKQPASAYVTAGDPASFSVIASSTLPLSYQWYTAPAGSSQFQAIASANGASYSVASTTDADDGSTYYVVVSNGSTAPVQSATAALFVGDPSGIDSCTGWNLSGVATYQGDCSYELTSSNFFQAGGMVWPELLSTANLTLSFTATISDPSSPPADGFAILLGDPTLGATLTSVGLTGEGLGARGIPGLALNFDDYQNGYDPIADYAQDPTVPYLGVGRGESSLWENPYFNVNTAIPALAVPGQTIAHDYVVTLMNNYMTVTMDGSLVFSGQVNAPPLAYLYVTASTGESWETTVISNIIAKVHKP